MALALATSGGRIRSFLFSFFFCCECVSVLVIFFCLFVSVSRLVLLFPCNKSFFFSFFLCFSFVCVPYLFLDNIAAGKLFAY